MGKLLVGLMTAAFFIFINVAVALSTSYGTSNPLTNTVILFQYVADIMLVIGTAWILVAFVRKAIRRSQVGGVSHRQSQSARYHADGLPFTDVNAGWRIVDTHSSLQYADAHLNENDVPFTQGDAQPWQGRSIVHSQPVNQHHPY